jgi:hypothetical protein
MCESGTLKPVQDILRRGRGRIMEKMNHFHICYNVYVTMKSPVQLLHTGKNVEK